MNPNARVHEVMQLATALIQIMSSEIEALKAHKISAIEPIQAQKANLSDLYYKNLQALAADPDALKGLDPKIRAELTRLATQVESTARENEKRVRAALEMNAGIVDRIARLAQASGPTASGYTATGAKPATTYGRTTMQAPVSLNQQL